MASIARLRERVLIRKNDANVLRLRRPQQYAVMVFRHQPVAILHFREA
jgi:hypothetical protein